MKKKRHAEKVIKKHQAKKSADLNPSDTDNWMINLLAISVERGNLDLVKVYLKDKTDVKPLDDTKIRHREFCLNMPPSIVLGGLSPLEVYTGRSVAFIV